MIGEETKCQILEKEGRLPDVRYCCSRGGSNAIGYVTDFIDEKGVRLLVWNLQVMVSKVVNMVHH